MEKAKSTKELIPYIKEVVEDFDYEISSKMQKLRTTIGNHFWKIISIAGYPYIWAFFGILFAFFDFFHVSYVIMFSGLSSLIIFPLKNYFRRKRPYNTHLDLKPLKKEREWDYSLPSGHTYNATVTGVALALCYGGAISLFLMIGLGILVAVSRIYLGVHFLSDVIAGFFLGLTMAFVVFLFFPYIMSLHYLTLSL